MVKLTRLNGEQFALSIDRIERCEERPDTVITTVGGNTYMVRETLDEVIGLVREAKASVLRELASAGGRASVLHLLSSTDELPS